MSLVTFGVSVRVLKLFWEGRLKAPCRRLSVIQIFQNSNVHGNFNFSFFFLQEKVLAMDTHFSKLPNSLIEICVVVGMDQDTGLVAARSAEVI